MRGKRPLFAIAAAATTFCVTARAADCTPATHQSPCFDADPLWIPAAPTRFVGIPGYRAPSPGSGSLGVAAGYVLRPVVLSAPSPDPAGRDVRVVDQVGNGTVTFAYSPSRRLELGLAIPFNVVRSGAGQSGVTSQRGPDLPGATLRDVRLGAGYELWSRHDATGTNDAGLIVRLAVSLPTGASGALAGERGPVVAPGVGFGFRRGPVFASAEQTLRLRQPVEIGGARLGTQLFSLLGVGADLLSRDRLSVALELWLAPSLTSQARTLSPRITVLSGEQVPAEWMLSARTRYDAFTLSAGGGTAIPLSDATRTSSGRPPLTSHFAGITSPELRFTLTLRYEVGAAPAR